jgi:hypothetical protein
MVIQIDYRKRKNIELFKTLEEPDMLFLSNTQNYIPTYRRFFSLNETNYNNINLSHKWYITNINRKDTDNTNLFYCKIKNINDQKSKEKKVFFKTAPLIDPYKYLIGKYNINEQTVFKLPSLNEDKSTNDKSTSDKFIDVNNSGYIDGFFSFLTSKLIYEYDFIHGVDYYGSFLSIKNNFKLNVIDDLEDLIKSTFFNNNRNVLFDIENFDHIINDNKIKLKPLNIQHNSTVKSILSIEELNNEIYDNIFEEEKINIFELDEISILPYNDNSSVTTVKTLKTDSTCSSRTSHTSTLNSVEDNSGDENSGDENSGDKNSGDENSGDENSGDENSGQDEWSNDDGSISDLGDETIDVIIPKFPVQVICMEYCENTFDDIILNNKLNKEEWYSALMQIIMILITYQKIFSFTHNDLHTNNVMYNTTTIKYINYVYKNKYYKVPTFGRIFKIIDFGRSIYKFNGQLFCSDSFKNGGDASTQYNTEPYFNENKPRLEPNYSFDLCRLACSIFDYLVDENDENNQLDITDPIKRLISEWCLDDNGVNLLYKKNGVDRYPDFKLYKMIARCVHNHTPQSQLERNEFKSFICKSEEISGNIINIDKMVTLV